MRTSSDVYSDFAGRRKGIVQALTTDVEQLYTQCDPNKDNLCLFGYPDGTWGVEKPAEEVPPEVPEPALGINFARDGMSKKDWLGLVAVHSDAWLMALAAFKGARLSREQREELYSLINRLPTCYEIVSGRVCVTQTLQQKRPGGAGPGGPRKNSRRDEEGDDEDATTGDGWEDGEGDPCPQCGRLYSKDEFWIACDYCDVWYCGKCAKMTASKADKIKSWKCPTCPPGEQS